MAGHYDGCPECGHADLAPRQIFIGQDVETETTSRDYREIFTLKCQGCGWLGETTISAGDTIEG